MKRILVTLMLMFTCATARGAIQIPADIVGEMLSTHFGDNAVNAAQGYRDMIAGGNGVTVDGLYKVCVAGGIDIKTPDGKSKCDKFAKELITRGSIKFFKVCNDDKGKSGGREVCVDNFFSDETFGGTQVDIRMARALAAEYVRVKHNDDSVVCSEDAYKCGGGAFNVFATDYCLPCTSTKTNTYYDFEFDDTKETDDTLIRQSLEKALCKLHGAEYTEWGQSGMTGDSGQVIVNKTWPSSCGTTNAALCAKISESATRFGRTTSIGSGRYGTDCVISVVGPASKDELRTWHGINNRAFRDGGVQLNAYVALDMQIRNFVASEIAPDKITSLKCNDASTPLYYVESFVSQVDEVLTCYVNGNPVDFLFDDLSESWGKISSGGAQGMGCIVSGGTYTGENCTHLDKKQCDALKLQNMVNCPECKMVQWDAENKLCLLPASTSAANLQKGIEITGTVVGGIVGVVGSAALIISTAPVSGFVAVATIVLEGGAIIGTGMEIYGEIEMSKAAQEFLTQVAKCKDASCAETAFAENFQRMANLSNEFSDAEINALDTEFARLATLLPADSVIYTGAIRDNQLAMTNPDSWEPEQVWRAVGVGLQLLPVIFSGGVKIFDMTTKNGGRVVDSMGRTSEALKSGYRKMRPTDPIDAEFWDAWKQFAPKDQSFNDFKKMWQGDIEKMRDGTKNWTALPKAQSEVDVAKKVLDETKEAFARASNKFDDTLQDVLVTDNSLKRKIWLEMVDGNEFSFKRFDGFEMSDWLVAHPSKANEILSGNPELLDLYKQQNIAHTNMLDAETGTLTRAYSTYDPEIARAKRQYQTEVAPFEAEFEQARQKIIAKYAQYKNADGKFPDDIQAAYDAEILAARKPVVDVQSKYIDKYAYKLSDEAKERVVQERVDLFMNKIKTDPELDRMARNFKNLSDDEKRVFAQKLIDASKEYNCSGDDCMVIMHKSADLPKKLKGVGGWQEPGGDLHIVSDVWKKLKGYSNTVAHEDGHRVDFINPNMGMLGSQKQNFGEEIYASFVEGTSYKTYYNNMTEQSSFAIGDALQKEIAKEYGTSLSNVDKATDWVSENSKTAIGLGAGAAAAEGYIWYNIVKETSKNHEQGDDDVDDE